jgi:aminopeptidase-like protein
VLDWVVPDEWNVREAWLRSESGETIVDFAHSNLHLMSYSVPISGTFSLQALREGNHLYTLPEHPDRIPYRTSYYRPH